MADAHKPLAISEVATAPSPATSGTSLVVTAGHGTRFPAVPFNATIGPVNSKHSIANAEIVRVTGISTDTLTITRAQESTTARTVIVGDDIYAGQTPKSFTDIETIVQNSQSSAYTLLITDGNSHIYHPSADTTARMWTIPANSSVAFPIGTAITFVNDSSAGVITIAITTDTLVLAGAGTTGSRTLAANGIATAIKMTATRWQINGTGLT